MKLVEMKGIKRPVRLLEWDDIKDFVEKDIRENKAFYEKLAQM